MNTPTVSVVMSVFNGEQFLSEAVDSVLNQSFGDFEFIVIDDGSSDGSGAILDSYEKRDARVHVYHQENQGLIASLNRGCGLARGKYIARMDADDIAAKDRLAMQVRFMDAHPDVAVLGGAVEFIDQTGSALRIAPHPLTHDEIERVSLDSSFMWHPSVLMRRDAFAAVGGYRNVVHAEDYDLWLRIADHFKLANLPEVLLKYRIHPGQVSVVRCRKQALGAAAARAAAVARRAGKRDPLDSVVEITPAVLSQLGVSEALQQTTLARAYLSTIRNMCESGEYALAINMLEILRSSELQKAATWTVADLHLCAARAYWQEKGFMRSILNAAQAVITRPTIVGRPLKPLVSWFSTGVAANLRLCSMISGCHLPDADVVAPTAKHRHLKCR